MEIQLSLKPRWYNTIFITFVPNLVLVGIYLRSFTRNKEFIDLRELNIRIRAKKLNQFGTHLALLVTSLSNFAVTISKELNINNGNRKKTIRAPIAYDIRAPSN